MNTDVNSQPPAGKSNATIYKKIILMIKKSSSLECKTSLLFKNLISAIYPKTKQANHTTTRMGIDKAFLKLLFFYDWVCMNRMCVGTQTTAHTWQSEDLVLSFYLNVGSRDWNYVTRLVSKCFLPTEPYYQT